MSRGQRRTAIAMTVAVVALAAALTASVRLPVSAQASVEGDVAAGERVFQANCAMCHGTDATGMRGMHPSLRGAIDRLSLEGVEVAIRNGRRTQPPMPAWDRRLSEDEITDVVAYIGSLPDGPRNFGPGEGSGGMMMDGGTDGGLNSGVVVGVLAVVAILAVAAAWAITRSRSPERIVARRYAAGELSHEEFLQRRDDLRAGGG